METVPKSKWPKTSEVLDHLVKLFGLLLKVASCVEMLHHHLKS